tara:strand:- start:3004 stop:3693 length:690 start_codon:yes stop_codon:yes gene_type:complete
MARISSYQYDSTITDTDAWIGSDSVTRATKQYTAESLADYLNVNSKINISARMVFKFISDESIATTGDFTGPLENATMISIDTMQLSTTDNTGQNVVGFMNYLKGNNILISGQNNVSDFGHFNIDSYEPNVEGFYTLNLTNIGGSGNLKNSSFYDFSVFQLSSQGTTTFIFEQDTPVTTWNVNHGLGKFPSITVINTIGEVVYGEHLYVDSNNVTISFSAPFAGEAYLN